MHEEIISIDIDVVGHKIAGCNRMVFVEGNGIITGCWGIVDGIDVYVNRGGVRAAVAIRNRISETVRAIMVGSG